MNVKCKFGFHQWDNCKCTKCGKIRNKQHNFSMDCEKCSNCGSTTKNQHNWNYCKCIKCGKIIENVNDWTIICKDCVKCNDSFIKAFESFKMNSFETAAYELQKIIITNESISQLKSATAIGLANIATNEVNGKIEYCKQFSLIGGGCSDLNTPFFEAQAKLKEAKDRAKDLYKLALNLEPDNEKILNLLRQLNNV